VLTNPSTGKMGFAIAEAAARRGAEVVLVAGPSPLETPAGVSRIDVVTSDEMWHAMDRLWESHDAVIFAAAVSDFRPAKSSGQKIKKDEAPREVALEPTVDIAATIGRHARERKSTERPILVGFAAETGDLEAHGRAKCEAKGFDFVVANEVGQADSGFGADTNRAVFVTHEGAGEPARLTTKPQLAEEILDRVANLLTKRGIKSAQ
jgi:phosphopantothenoylcysteine decarboxylase/phosphopantothenate--cysteine ligase